MTTRRARKHKELVNFEKKFHHRAGTHLHQHYKTRWRGLVHAVMAEPACEWYVSDKQYQEIARELF